MTVFRLYMLVLLLSLGLVASCAVVGDEGVLVGPSDDSSPRGEVSDLTVSFSVCLEGSGGIGGAEEFSGSNVTDDLKSRSVLNPGVGTEEGIAPGYVPLDVWVIQYGGVEDASPLIGRPNYVELLPSGQAQVQAVISAAPNTLVFVVNTHDANIEWGDISTLGKLSMAHKTITCEKDLYGNNFNPSLDLVLSGMYQGAITTGPISANLSRNVVRLDLSLKNGAASGMTLHSVQLCNVPQNFYYAEGAVSRASVFPVESEFVDLAKEAITGASTPGSAQNFTFYLPANRRGVAMASTSSKTKPAHAPSYATHLRILATDAQGQGYVYKIYPGANLINDYNLLPNRRYTIEWSVNSPGDASTDQRLDFYGRTELPSSNCYILNPAPEGVAPRVFTIPIDRVNQYWMDTDPSLTIGPDDDWTVELLWQDIPTSDFIRFLDPSGALSTTFSGTGADQRIVLTTSHSYQGNALIGIKKVGRQDVGYLWSWHLWVTDYQPEYRAAPVLGQYIYSVPGGQVHRYSGDAWSSQAGTYYSKYIMDRHLGARNTKNSGIGGLFYQWGRKDPMPYVEAGNVLYNIKGEPLALSDPLNASHNRKSALQGVAMAQGVLNPTAFYYREPSSGNGDWTSQGRAGDHSWNNPTSGVDLKSLFDPCPTGWKVPLHTIWLDFRYNQSYPQVSTTLNMARSEKLGWFYGNSGGLRYWPLDQKIVGEIHYPAVGVRNQYNGYMHSVGVQGICWAALAPNPLQATHLTSGVNFCSANGLDFRSYAFSVRCVQE